MNSATLNVTLQITDINGTVFERNYLPFGTNIKLKIESAEGSKTSVVVPDSCHLISVISKRKYVILKHGCGDGIIISKTDGFIIRNGTGYSSVFRALDFSNDNMIKFSCYYMIRKATNAIRSCKSASAMLKAREYIEGDKAKMDLEVTGNNSGMLKVVRTRVVGLTFPQQYVSKLKRGNLALSNNGTSQSNDVKSRDVSLHGRRLIFILAFLGLYIFILAVFISIQIDRNRLEGMRNPVL